MSAYVRDVNEENFQTAVLDASEDVPVVVDFWAEWCGPCRQLAPVLERLVAEQNGKVLLAKVNVDEAQQLASYFQIDGIPAVKIFYGKQLIHEFEGLLPEPQLRDIVGQLAKLDKSIFEGNANLEAEETPPPAQKSETELRAALQAEDLPETRVDLAELLFEEGRFDEIASLLEPVGSGGDAGARSDKLLARLWIRTQADAGTDPYELQRLLTENPKDPAARVGLGIHLADQGQHQKALEVLLSAGELDYKLLESKVKEAMVKIFYAVGTGSDLANEYRSKLSRLLY